MLIKPAVFEGQECFKIARRDMHRIGTVAPDTRIGEMAQRRAVTIDNHPGVGAGGEIGREKGIKGKNCDDQKCKDKSGSTPHAIDTA